MQRIDMGAAPGLARKGTKVAKQVVRSAAGFTFGAISVATNEMFHILRKIGFVNALAIVIVWGFRLAKKDDYPGSGVANLNCPTRQGDGSVLWETCQGWGKWDNFVALGVLAWFGLIHQIVQFRDTSLRNPQDAGAMLSHLWTGKAILWGVALGTIEANAGSGDAARVIALTATGVLVAYLCFILHVHQDRTRTLNATSGLLLGTVACLTVILSQDIQRSGDAYPQWAKIPAIATLVCLWLCSLASIFPNRYDPASEDYSTVQVWVLIASWVSSITLLNALFFGYIAGAK